MAYVYDAISLKNGREVNMDSLLMKERAIGGQDVCMAVVCDGVGSMADGAFAAYTAVRQLSAWFEGLRDTRRLGLRLRDKVAELDRTITESAQQKGIKTGCTLSALIVAEEQYYIVHAGDSRIYGYQDGVLEQLTIDHSTNGKLSSCVGRNGNATLYYNEGTSSKRLFFLCSDGLYKRMDPVFFVRALSKAGFRPFRKTIAQLTQYVIERGERDNISLVLLKTEK